MFVIGIAGGTGSGKTTFTENLVEKFKDDVTVIHHDNYYKVQDHLSYEERCKTKWEHFVLYVNILQEGQSNESGSHDSQDSTISFALST